MIVKDLIMIVSTKTTPCRVPRSGGPSRTTVSTRKSCSPSAALSRKTQVLTSHTYQLPIMALVLNKKLMLASTCILLHQLLSRKIDLIFLRNSKNPKLRHSSCLNQSTSRTCPLYSSQSWYSILRRLSSSSPRLVWLSRPSIRIHQIQYLHLILRRPKSS